MEYSLYITAAVGLGIVGWYLYQIGSRKKKALGYKLKKMVVGLGVYLGSAFFLMNRGLPPLEALPFAVLIGLGAGWVLVKQPKMDRRIPKAMRRQVIVRDLESKGLTWDPEKYHIDHIVPFSRGGDNSLRNLVVVQKHANLRKGAKMPGPRDFIRRK